jgi:Uma2 family endonuclease
MAAPGRADAPFTSFPEVIAQAHGDEGAGMIPPLHSGDRVSADEFERRYRAMPGTRAELIEGVVYVASPVSADHGEPHMGAIFWLGAYLTGTPGVVGGVDTTIRLDLDNRPQPDGHLRILPEYGGNARLSPDRFVVGAPELVIEIARSTVSYDLHDKLDAYRRNEVRDYVVWRVDDRAIDWFWLDGGTYRRMVLSPDGLYRSLTLPGLWLDPSALLGSNYAAILEAVQRGIASPEHAAFVERLNADAARIAATAPEPEDPRP